MLSVQVSGLYVQTNEKFRSQPASSFPSKNIRRRQDTLGKAGSMLRSSSKHTVLPLAPDTWSSALPLNTFPAALWPFRHSRLLHCMSEPQSTIVTVFISSIDFGHAQIIPDVQATRTQVTIPAQARQGKSQAF